MLTVYSSYAQSLESFRQVEDDTVIKHSMRYTYVSSYDNLKTRFLEDNTVYIIRGELDLSRYKSEIAVGTNCILDFSEGGKIRNGVLRGNRTRIEANGTQIFDSILFEGSFLIDREVLPQWFGAQGDSESDDTKAIQDAVDFAIITKSRVFIPSGEYKTSRTITVKSSIKIEGAGRWNTTLSYSGSEAAIECREWSGIIANMQILITDFAASGIKLGYESRNNSLNNLEIRHKYDHNKLVVGTGILLDARNNGWSGGLEIRTTRVLGFKDGIRMLASDSTNCWTTVSIFNSFLIGRNSRKGGAGIYMDSNTTGIGTCMYGGTIEGFDYGIMIEEGSYGGIFETDMEGNTNNYKIGKSFKGRILSAFGIPMIEQATGPTDVNWYKRSCENGGPEEVYYYPPRIQIAAEDGAFKSINVYHSTGDIASGTMSESGTPLKFSIGLGESNAYGSDIMPSEHYIQVCENKIHWGKESPANRTGKQLVIWRKGDVCFNLNCEKGEPMGWMCVQSGKPGVWLAMPNL